MDAFYAAVEQRDRPELRGRPVIVGGLGRRGVVSTASYEARRFGVRSAMPTATARRLCPDGVYLTPRMDAYAAVSELVFEVFGRYTPVIEGLSLDEAFLDVTASRALFGDLPVVGARIKADVRAATGLTCSVGLAHNKFLAKLASELGKPDGLRQILEHEAQSVLGPLPVSRLWTVGPVANARLERAGIRTVAQLRAMDADTLKRLMGESGALLMRLARGEDDRPVSSARDERSISAETTFETDLGTLDDSRRWLMRLTERVGERTRASGLAGRTVGVKLRIPPFENMTRQCTLTTPTASTDVLFEAADRLLTRWWREQRQPRLRLLGVSLSGFDAAAPQPGLFDPAPESATDKLQDAINRKFGKGALRRGRGLER
jgi:DNA polymerase-4